MFFLNIVLFALKSCIISFCLFSKKFWGGQNRLPLRITEAGSVLSLLQFRTMWLDLLLLLYWQTTRYIISQNEILADMTYSIIDKKVTNVFALLSQLFCRGTQLGQNFAEATFIISWTSRLLLLFCNLVHDQHELLFQFFLQIHSTF